VRAVAVALLLEEQRGEILGAWRRDVERELGGDPVLAFAVGPLLREMALALRGEASPLLGGAAVAGGEAGARSAVLVRSGASSARLAREFKLLHRAVWHALRQAGAFVGAEERRAADEWLDEALAATLDRQDRVRTRADLFDPAEPPAAVAARSPLAARPAAPAPARPAAPRATPPPLPVRAPPQARSRPADLPPVIAARPPPLPRAAQRPPPVAAPDLLGME
jgi:hypothetical protein